ncbi:hypothetical protein ACWD7Y_27640, partial [Streptomyces drozdowiczii]
RGADKYATTTEIAARDGLVIMFLVTPGHPAQCRACDSGPSQRRPGARPAQPAGEGESVEP